MTDDIKEVAAMVATCLAFWILMFSIALGDVKWFAISVLMAAVAWIMWELIDG